MMELLAVLQSTDAPLSVIMIAMLWRIMGQMKTQRDEMKVLQNRFDSHMKTLHKMVP